MRQLLSIQYLRALAALMVVIGHAQHDATVWADKTGGVFRATHLLPWGGGVDLFFVISGFIMVYASRDLFAQPKAWSIFAKRRLIRIVPLYWIMATLYLLMAYVQSVSIGKPMSSPSAIVASYLFWPVDAYANGLMQPFYTLGWTLNYEVFFYACFALTLCLPRAFALITLSVALAAFVAAASIVKPGLAPLAFWSQPIIIEFVIGMLIAQAYLRGVRIGQTTAFALGLIGVAWLSLDTLGTAQQPQGWTTPNDIWRLIGWGLPAAMLVLAASLREPAPTGETRHHPLGALLGDASYALYLSHPFIIVLMRKALLATGVFQTAGGWSLVICATIVSCIVAIALHRHIEVPLGRALSQWFKAAAPRQTTPLSPQAA